MTSTSALVLAMSLMINGFQFIIKESILDNQHYSSNLVFLLSVSLVLREIDVIPKALSRDHYLVSVGLELLLSIVLLESSLHFIWSYVQDYILQHSDDILVHVSENLGFDWLICHLCCGKNDCTDEFTALVIKIISFLILFPVCCFSLFNKSKEN